MLSHGDAAAMQSWVHAANGWAEAAQSLVGAAATLALASRSLADEIDETTPAPDPTAEVEEDALTASLRQLGEEVETETAGLRDRYLATAANIDQYKEILG